MCPRRDSPVLRRGKRVTDRSSLSKGIRRNLGKKYAPGATRTRNRLIRSHSIVVYSMHMGMFLSMAPICGKKSLFVQYFYHFYTSCTTVASKII